MYAIELDWGEEAHSDLYGAVCEAFPVIKVMAGDMKTTDIHWHGTDGKQVDDGFYGRSVFRALTPVGELWLRLHTPPEAIILEDA